MPAFNPALPLPAHIAIIMDGNGRWARERGKIRLEGHREGAASVETTIEACWEIGIPCLTLYAFSSENWKRPDDEVSGLMNLLTHFLNFKTPKLLANDIRLRVIGAVEKLPSASRTQLEESIAATAGCQSMTLNLALSYGAREEIVRATRMLMEKAARGEIQPEDITVENFGDYLYTRGSPDPDLLIRTSGEMRVSNFLLWQISYAEIYVTETLWPDFRRQHLEEAIASFQTRQRRFGGL